MYDPIAEYSADRISEGETEETDSLLTVGRVASLLQVHSNTVRKWSNLVILSSFRIGPRRDRRFRKEEIATFLPN